MLKKVTDLKSAHEFVKEGWRMIKQYGWYNETVMPYMYPVKVTKLLHEIADYDRCTNGSQEYLNSLANGLGNILNHWEEYELESRVDVVMKSSGEVTSVAESFAKILVGCGEGKYLDDIFIEEMQKKYDEIDHSDYIIW